MKRDPLNPDPKCGVGPLTVRHEMATTLMAGMMAGNRNSHEHATIEMYANCAVLAADALIARLNQGAGK